jgi:hypothetical protein
MPETDQNVINACGAKIELDDALGVLKNISGTGNEANIDLDQELGEYKVFGNAWKFRIACARDGSFELSLFYSTGADGGLKVVRDWYFQAPGTARTLRITVGNDYYEAEVKLEKLTIPLKSDDAKPVTVKATLKAHGEVIQATAA